MSQTDLDRKQKTAPTTVSVKVEWKQASENNVAHNDITAFSAQRLAKPFSRWTHHCRTKYGLINTEQLIAEFHIEQGRSWEWIIRIDP